MKKDKTLISGQSEAQDTPERQAGRLTLFALLLLVLMGIFLLRVRAVGGITFPSSGWLVLVFAGLTILLLVALVLSGLSLAPQAVEAALSIPQATRMVRMRSLARVLRGVWGNSRAA